MPNTPPNFKLQIVTQNDIADLLDVYRQCEDFLALGPDPKASPEMVLEDMEGSAREGGAFYGIYDSKDQLIGVADFASKGFEGKSQVAFIFLLMIASSHRRRGIGTEIVQWIEREIFKSPQVTEIRSGVQVNNPQALCFWEKNGYRVVGGPEVMPDRTTVYHLCKDRGKVRGLRHPNLWIDFRKRAEK